MNAEGKPLMTDSALQNYPIPPARRHARVEKAFMPMHFLGAVGTAVFLGMRAEVDGTPVQEWRLATVAVGVACAMCYAAWRLNIGFATVDHRDASVGKLRCETGGTSGTLGGNGSDVSPQYVFWAVAAYPSTDSNAAKGSFVGPFACIGLLGVLLPLKLGAIQLPWVDWMMCIPLVIAAGNGMWWLLLAIYRHERIVVNKHEVRIERFRWARGEYESLLTLNRRDDALLIDASDWWLAPSSRPDFGFCVAWVPGRRRLLSCLAAKHP